MIERKNWKAPPHLSGVCRQPQLSTLFCTRVLFKILEAYLSRFSLEWTDHFSRLAINAQRIGPPKPLRFYRLKLRISLEYRGCDFRKLHHLHHPLSSWLNQKRLVSVNLNNTVQIFSNSRSLFRVKLFWKRLSLELRCSPSFTVLVLWSHCIARILLLKIR